MQGINKAILVGNIGSDAELRHFDGRPKLRVRLATSRRWTTKEGERRERTDWHTVVMWGPRAERLAEMLRKGRRVGVEGRLRVDQWHDAQGKRRESVEVEADDIALLDAPARPDRGEASAAPFGADDLPF